MAQSTATDRKIRIIEAALGADWRTLHEGWSIDRIYNHVQGDDRKNLFFAAMPGQKSIFLPGMF